MTSKDLSQDTPKFYNEYFKDYFWDIHEFTTLSLSLNPKGIIPKDYNEEYLFRVKLLKQAMISDENLKLDGIVLVGWGSLAGYEEYPKIWE